MAAKKFVFDHPDDALRAIAQLLSTVPIVSDVPIDDCIGRVLADDVVADRDSPAADVSAMDGYAIRMCDLRSVSEVPISGETAPGGPPPQMSVARSCEFLPVRLFPTNAKRSSYGKTPTNWTERFGFGESRGKRRR